MSTTKSTIIPLVLLLCAIPYAGFSQDQQPSSEAPRFLALDVSLVRFKPNKPERVLKGFRDLSGNIAEVVENLKKDGAVSVLYIGSREVRLEDKLKVRFDATETRPVVLLGKPGAPVPPVTMYGLTLEMTPKPLDNRKFSLSWEGSVTWSPDIVDEWTSEKFLNFVTSAADLAKQTGLVKASDQKSVDSATGIGLGLAQLFSPKGVAGDSQIYELPVNKTIALSSSRIGRSGELFVSATTAEMGTKETQTILLLIYPVVHE